MRIYKLDNPVQRYSWGSADGITSALGLPNPAGGPFAELWMGAHPSAPSMARVGDRAVGLDELIAADPVGCLGRRCIERLGPELPFLFKALSAGSPLSIQAHPGKRKAELGFERENLSGVPVDAPERTYRDPNHKPEASVALTRLELLCGFRPIDEMMAMARALGESRYDRAFDRLARNPSRMELSVIFYTIISSEERDKLELLDCCRAQISTLLERGEAPEGSEATFRWILRLMDLFPGDIGALAPIVLNLVTIEPGWSVAIAPGELHAYLSGTCLEIMANSDNVIRGALTRKHVDLPELVSVLSFKPERVAPVLPTPGEDGEETYPTFVPDFQISRVPIGAGGRCRRTPTGPEILLCASGEIELRDGGGGEFALSRGESAFVAADAGPCSGSSEGGALLYRASVPALP